MVKAVGIRDLKTHLSQYLREVQAGTTVTVTDHGRPIAELRAIPKISNQEEEVFQRLAAEGAATLPEPGVKLGPFEPIAFRSDVSVVDLIRQDREDRF